MVATEDVLIVTVDGDPLSTVVPVDDPTRLGQLLLDKIATNLGDGAVSTMHAQRATREFPDA
jgi:hypothetical protein